jgi:hypothetical protein
MRAARALAAFLATAGAPAIPGAQPGAPAEPAGRAAIAEARAVYREVQAAVEAKRLRKLQRSFEYCQAYEDTERTLYRDKRGNARAYRFAGGSEDSTAERTLYYDRSGRLRFALIRAGAVNGTSLQHRIYLGKTGKRLREERALLKGPGYTFPNPWPAKDLFADPKRAFDAASLCSERK